MRGRWPFRLLLAGTGLIFLTMELYSLPALRRFAGGQEAFDLRLSGYGLAEARAYLAALGEGGRHFYLTVQHPLDTVFPAALALCLIGVARRLNGAVSLVLICGFALLGAGSDYQENASVRGLLLVGADGVSAEAVAQASRWTILKSAAFGASIGGLLLLLARAGQRRVKG